MNRINICSLEHVLLKSSNEQSNISAFLSGLHDVQQYFIDLIFFPWMVIQKQSPDLIYFIEVFLLKLNESRKLTKNKIY